MAILDTVKKVIASVAAIPPLAKVDGYKTLLGGAATAVLYFTQAKYPDIAPDLTHIAQYFSIPLFSLGILDKLRKLHDLFSGSIQD